MNGKIMKLDSADCDGSSEGSDHDNEQHAEANVKLLKKLSKKPKKTDDGEEQSKETPSEKSGQTGTGNKIDKRVFGILKNFQDGTNVTPKMLQDLVALLQEESSEKRNATATYVVKRLIRATGADNKNTAAKVGSIIKLIIKNVPYVNELDLLDIVERELPVNGQPKKKEEALAAVGQMITAGTIIQLSTKQSSTKRELAPIYTKLMSYLKGREYLMCMSNNLIVESFETVPEERFATDVWPVLKKEIAKPVSELNLHTFDVLLAVHDSYNNVLTHDQLVATLWPTKTRYSELFRIYLAAPKMYDAGIYARFGKFLGTADTNAEMLESWLEYAYEHRAQNVASKGCIFKVLEHQLVSHRSGNEQPLIDLFASPLMDFILDELLAAKAVSAKKEKPLTLQLRRICQEFECAVVLLFENPATGDETKAKILSNLLSKRGNLNEIATMRRFTETLLNTLKYEGLQTIFDLNTTLLATPVGAEAQPENGSGSRNQLECVNQMQAILQHTELEGKNADKRWKMLKTILTAGHCHVAAGLQPCLPAESILSEATADRCKTIFFGSLVRNCHGDIKELCQLLRTTVKFLKKFMSKTLNSSAQRHASNDEQQLAWDVLTELEKSDDNEDSAQIIEVLILFVGLAQYTSCCQLPSSILNDLLVCRKMKISEQKVESEEEPSWQEVVTDILLQLLLETAAHWREFTNIILKSMLPHLGQAHLLQMLQRLDMDSNPLGEDGDESSSDEEENENENEEEEDSNDDDSSADEDNNSDDGEEEGEGAGEDADNALDKLRDSVRQALENGDDDDGEASSVDWNDVDEESGKRLDKSLAAIFKVRHQTQQRKKRPTKSDRIHSTSLLHFRVRVLDLVEVFASKKPTLDVILDVFQCVYQVFCRTISVKDQRPLHHASQKLLGKLIAKEITFEDAQDRGQIPVAIEELFAATSSALESRQIRGVPNSRELQQRLVMWRDKCFAALITQCSDKEDIDNSVAWPLLKAMLDEWLPGRKSKQPLFGFEAIFQYEPTWPGVNQLVALLVSHLHATATHPMKRLVIVKLLAAHKNRIKPTVHTQKSVIAGLKKYASNLLETDPLTPSIVQELKTLKQYLNPKLEETKKILTNISKSLDQFHQTETKVKRKTTTQDEPAPVATKKTKKERAT
ncbi:myb-binding protein 1A [Drosophila guanche]|uniref:Blast:Protein suppressor of sable n=1 Tax=Drosophila guanche TaxID=7266 RepID=A0A3B0K5U7_DROGU|nr:myb-binding protein 1A [Drosophila guanche]SPP89495.1 blast:Protein suppressor of sable [Drosophila guanche]